MASPPLFFRKTKMESLRKFIDQLVALAWIKCALSEGIQFINKQTNQPETKEMVIFQHWEHQTGIFDVPDLDVSPKKMEHYLFEIIGRFFINTNNQEVQLMLAAPELKSMIKEMVKKIQEKDKQMLRGSSLE